MLVYVCEMDWGTGGQSSAETIDLHVEYVFEAIFSTGESKIRPKRRSKLFSASSLLSLLLPTF